MKQQVLFWWSKAQIFGIKIGLQSDVMGSTPAIGKSSDG